jgi:copper chaperone CopZ
MTPNAKTYTVIGMSCEHCRSAVLAEVSQVEGVAAAEVDLAAGTLTVRGTEISDGAIRDAVDEAGYEVAP